MTQRSDKRRIVGVFGGSFNPVHTGHLIVASYIAQWSDADEVWLMLSPLNPFKAADPELIAVSPREDMLRVAVEESGFLKVCDTQLSLPVPSYTIDALDALSALYPDCDFRCIIGSDSWGGFPGWRESARIISDYGVIIYPRPGYPVDASALPSGVEIVDAPTVEISSTFIREACRHGKDISYLVPQSVRQYILDNNLYKDNTL